MAQAVVDPIWKRAGLESCSGLIVLSLMIYCTILLVSHIDIALYGPYMR